MECGFDFEKDSTEKILVKLAVCVAATVVLIVVGVCLILAKTALQRWLRSRKAPEDELSGVGQDIEAQFADAARLLRRTSVRSNSHNA